MNDIIIKIYSGMRAMDKKYGPGVAIKRLEEYIMTGNINLISNVNNFRDYISCLKPETLLTAYNTIIDNNLNFSSYISSISTNNFYENLDNIVSNITNSRNNSPFVNDYSTLIRMNSFRKKIPNKTDYDLFKINIGQYAPINKGGFIHTYSNDFELKKLEHRLYINAEYKDIYIFLIKFIEKCKLRNIPFYFKTSCFYEDIGKYSLDSATSRSESTVIYASDEKLIREYIDIAMEIKEENSNLQLNHQPTISTNIIDGWLGYGMEPNQESKEKFYLYSGKNKCSYNGLRALILGLGINRGINLYIEKKGSKLKEIFEQTILKYYNLYYQKLYNDYKKINIQEATSENDLRKQVDFDIQSKIYANFYEKYIKKDKEVLKFIEYAIKETSLEFGIDPNIFSINIDYNTNKNIQKK